MVICCEDQVKLHQLKSLCTKIVNVSKCKTIVVTETYYDSSTKKGQVDYQQTEQRKVQKGQSTNKKSEIFIT